jgi:hypothetical protein
MSGKVYAVTRGSYSDYTIEAIFTDKTRAESYLSGLDRNDDPNIEEFDLDPEEPGQRVPAGYFLFLVAMFDTGATREIYRKASGGQFMDDKKPEWKVLKPYYTSNEPPVLFATVLARSEKHAVKIVNERRASLIASGNWREGAKGSDFAEVPCTEDYLRGLRED